MLYHIDLDEFPKFRLKYYTFCLSCLLLHFFSRNQCYISTIIVPYNYFLTNFRLISHHNHLKTIAIHDFLLWSNFTFCMEYQIITTSVFHQHSNGSSNSPVFHLRNLWFFGAGILEASVGNCNDLMAAQAVKKLFSTSSIR